MKGFKIFIAVLLLFAFTTNASPSAPDIGKHFTLLSFVVPSPVFHLYVPSDIVSYSLIQPSVETAYLLERTVLNTIKSANHLPDPDLKGNSITVYTVKNIRLHSYYPINVVWAPPANS